MPYITILGAGSTMFARQLMTDILQIEGLDEGCFALVDIDPSRLELAHQLAERLITQSGKRWSVRASTERRDLLTGSDFIINSIEVAGLANVRHDFDIPMKYGINHNAWFTELRYQGQDMYPRLRELAQVPEIYERDPVRFEIMRYFGAFVTESSGHFSEYVPYFRKRPELIEQYCRAGYLGETGFYANNWPSWRERNDAYIRSLLANSQPLPFNRSHEYGSFIIEAIAMRRPAVIYGNVRNTGLIDNLLPGGCVEVA